MKQINKEQWVEDTLNSLDGSTRAPAPDHLLENALRRASFGPARRVRMPATQIWSAAACALLLVVANLFMCLNFAHSDNKNSASREQFAKEYFGASDAIPF